MLLSAPGLVTAASECGPHHPRVSFPDSSSWVLEMQQSAGNSTVSQLVVQRREMQQSAAARLWQRLRGTTPRLDPADWFYLDRVHWQAYPDRRTSPFVRACIYNTMQHRPQEYETIRQRREYYRAMSWVLQNRPGLPANAAPIRFFDAAAEVIDSPGIGTLEAPAGLLVSAEARRVLIEVNQLLLDANMRVISRIITSRTLVDPDRGPTPPPSGLEFDLRMVEHEQQTVQEYILGHQTQLAAVQRELDNLLNDTRATVGVEALQIEWAKAAVEAPRLTFIRQDHRVAVGKALVFGLHGRSRDEYLDRMRSN